MFPGLAERILRNFGLSQDSALVISSGGTNLVPVEMAELFQKKVSGRSRLISRDHSLKSSSKRSMGKTLRLC